MEEKRVLWIALDDSNHTTHGPKPEICLACFSTRISDSYMRFFPKKRESSLISKLQSPYIDYRFLLLSGNEVQTGENTLVVAAPNLILSYLQKKEKFNKLRIFVDGRLSYKDKQRLRQELSDYTGEINSMGFIKYYERDPKNKKIKCYQQPSLLGLADALAHDLYSNFTLEELMKHRKRVNLT